MKLEKESERNNEREREKEKERNTKRKREIYVKHVKGNLNIYDDKDIL